MEEEQKQIKHVSSLSLNVIHLVNVKIINLELKGDINSPINCFYVDEKFFLDFARKIEKKTYLFVCYLNSDYSFFQRFTLNPSFYSD